MLFALICKDKPGQLERRLASRPDHVAWLQDLDAKGKLKLAGPFLDEAGKPCGSLVVIAAADRVEAEETAARDPYARAGLFESVEIRPWNWAFKNPEAA